MSKSFRFGSAISIVAMASFIGGCAAPQTRVASGGFGGKANGNVGLATKAMAALNSNDIPMAIDFGQQAVAATPNDAGFRALLGNAYFAAGRFQSAESAYKDSLTLYSNQPRVILKLALVEIGLGKNASALAFLQAGRSVLDPSDYGLAVALAGQPAEAVEVLEAAARAPGADARVRQNLALAYALSGDWTNARAVASQDIPSDQLDARIHQWMQMATPQRASDQIASLVGVTPAAIDPGQPVQLALNKTDTRLADAAPVQAPAPAPAPQPLAVGEAAEAMPAPQPVEMADAASAQPLPQPAPIPVMEAAAPKLVPAPRFVSKRLSKTVDTAIKMARAELKGAPKAQFHRASAPRAESKAVVQLGAYSNAGSVLVAWDKKVHHYRSLAEYTPMSARYASSKGTFYRLSVQGFGSVNEAIALCSSLRRSGASCFVRKIAGDAPVNIAMR